MARTSFMSMTVGPVHRQTHRNALGFGQQATLDPAFAAVSGVGAGFSPRPGAIWSWRRPYSANSSPAPSVRHSVQSHPPQLQEHPSGNPFLKAQVGGGPGADARGVQRLPLAASAQHVEDAIGQVRSGTRGAAAAETMGVQRACWGINGASTSQSSSEIWNAPVVGLVLVAGPARFGRGGLASFALVIAPV